MKMEDLMLKFPHLSEQIFQKLNNESLFKSREVARSWKYFIDERNYSWLCVVNIPTILKNGNTYLHLSAETGQNDAFKIAFSEEEDKNTKNLFRETAFHVACKNGHSNIVNVLVESSIAFDTNCIDIFAKVSPFILACQRGHTNVAKGQLISKCPYEIIVSPKIPMKLFLDFCPGICCSFLEAFWCYL